MGAFVGEVLRRRPVSPRHLEVNQSTDEVIPWFDNALAVL